MACDGLAQLFKRSFVELAARLEAVRLDELHQKLCGGTCLCRRFRRLLGRELLRWFWRARKGIFPKTEGAEPASESACLSLLHAS